MIGRSLELGDASLTIVNGSAHALRGERIARLTFEYVRELMEHELRNVGGDVSVAGIEVSPIQVSLDTMDDEAIARAGAEAIRSALLAVI